MRGAEPDQVPRKPPPVEPEVWLPDDPHHAGAIFLAVLAYPGGGEGQPGAKGSAFATALLGWLARNAARYHPHEWQGVKRPTARDIDGTISRGARRIRRALGARELAAWMALQAHATATRGLRDLEARRGLPPSIGPKLSQVTFHRPTFRGFVAADLLGWARKLSLKDGAVVSAEVEELHKKVRGDFRSCLPVLHLAQALYESQPPELWLDEALSDRDIVLGMVAKSPTWIWPAVESCERLQDYPALMFWERSPQVLIRRQEISPMPPTILPI